MAASQHQGHQALRALDIIFATVAIQSLGPQGIHAGFLQPHRGTWPCMRIASAWGLAGKQLGTSCLL